MLTQRLPDRHRPPQTLCWIAIFSLLAYGLLFGPGTYSLRFGVLPLWTYDHRNQAIRAANSSTLAIFGALVLLLGWSTLAAYTEILTLATLLSYLAAYLCYTYCLHYIHKEQASARGF